MLREQRTTQSLKKILNKKYKVLAFWALIVLFGGFLLWAAFVPLADVPRDGKVVVDTKRKGSIQIEA